MRGHSRALAGVPSLGASAPPIRLVQADPNWFDPLCYDEDVRGRSSTLLPARDVSQWIAVNRLAGAPSAVEQEAALDLTAGFA
jgi:hypothetical protein